MTGTSIKQSRAITMLLCLQICLSAVKKKKQFSTNATLLQFEKKIGLKMKKKMFENAFRSRRKETNLTDCLRVEYATLFFLKKKNGKKTKCVFLQPWFCSCKENLNGQQFI